MRGRLFVAMLAGLLLADAARAQQEVPRPAPVRPYGAVVPAPAAERPPPSPSMPMPTGCLTSPLPGGAVPPPEVFPTRTPCGPSERFWMQNEATLWWVQGMHTPALLASSPPGTPGRQAGQLDLPGAQIASGFETVNTDTRVGYKLRMGGWLDDANRIGLEGNFFATSALGTSFGIGSGGSPILGRPIQNAVTNAQSSIPIAAPDVASGAFTMTASSSGLIGAGVWLRENICCSGQPFNTCRLCDPGCGPGGCGGGASPDHYFRIDSLLGYRYLRLADRLVIADDVTNQVDLPSGVAGSRTRSIDQFSTTNNFHGVDLGLISQVQRGAWNLEVISKVALGYQNAAVSINGARTISGPDGTLTTLPGGRLTQPTNINEYGRTSPTVVPEFGVKLAYQFRPNLRAYVGYTFLYWYHVVRAGDQVDVGVNRDLLSATPPTNPDLRRPTHLFVDNDIWAQAISFGLEWRY